MMEWVQTLPIVGGVAFLYLVILLRAGGTYALGRGARKAANRGKVAAWLESERVERASRIINKWGAPVVAFSFLTVGFQTAANAAAGLTGMSLKRYLRSEEHTSELQSRGHLVCRLLLEKKNDHRCESRERGRAQT